MPNKLLKISLITSGQGPSLGPLMIAFRRCGWFTRTRVLEKSSRCGERPPLRRCRGVLGAAVQTAARAAAMVSPAFRCEAYPLPRASASPEQPLTGSVQCVNLQVLLSAAVLGQGGPPDQIPSNKSPSQRYAHALEPMRWPFGSANDDFWLTRPRAVP